MHDAHATGAAGSASVGFGWVRTFARAEFRAAGREADREAGREAGREGAWVV